MEKLAEVVEDAAHCGVTARSRKQYLALRYWNNRPLDLNTLYLKR